MGRRGPPPRPAAIAKLGPKSHHKKVKLPGTPVIVRVGAPDVPDSVRRDKLALAIWHKLRKTLLTMKVMTKEDAMSFEGLCIAYARAQRADKLIRRHGLVVLDRLSGQLRGNPAVSMSRQSWVEVRHFAQEFGLTPAARTRVRSFDEGGEEGAKKKDTAEEFIFRKSAKRVSGLVGTISPKGDSNA